MFSASGTARARSFCTHERTRTTESTVFEHIHHKDRRKLQLFQRLALRGRASLTAVSFFKTHQIDLLLCFRAEPQTSREVDQDPEGGLARQCNTRPSFLIMCCLWESLSQDDLLLGMGQPCVICQDKTHLLEFRLRVGTGARCVRAEGSRSLA